MNTYSSLSYKHSSLTAKIGKRRKTKFGRIGSWWTSWSDNQVDILVYSYKKNNSVVDPTTIISSSCPSTTRSYTPDKFFLSNCLYSLATRLLINLSTPSWKADGNLYCIFYCELFNVELKHNKLYYIRFIFRFVCVLIIVILQENYSQLLLLFHNNLKKEITKHRSSGNGMCVWESGKKSKIKRTHF